MSEPTLFDVLGEIGQKNYRIPDILTDDELKKFPPFVLLQWMKGSELSVSRLQAVNHQFFSHDPSTQMRLLATIPGSPSKKRWKWVGKKQTDSDQQLIDAIQSIHQVDRNTAISVVDLLSVDEQVELLSAYGSGDNGTKSTKPKRPRKKTSE
jgi:hypothetical protein